MCFIAAVSGDEPSYSEIATAVAAGKLAPRGRRCATFPRTRAPSWFQLQTSGTLATKSSHMCWESLEASVPRDGAPTMIWRCFLHKIARDWARSSLFADVRSFRVDRSLPVRLAIVPEYW